MPSLPGCSGAAGVPGSGTAGLALAAATIRSAAAVASPSRTPARGMIATASNAASVSMMAGSRRCGGNPATSTSNTAS